MTRINMPELVSAINRLMLAALAAWAAFEVLR